MRFAWLKRWMPRGLYGRAALILILPVITVQLVVSVVFIQRHFADVTAQMTRNVLAETRYLVAQVNAAPDLAAAQRIAADLAPALELGVGLPAPLSQQDRRVFYDLSGRTVIGTLREELPGVAGIDLAGNLRQVRLSVDTAHGGMEIRVPRVRVSASNPHQLLVWLIFTGGLMTLISFLFLRNQLRPITRLAAAAQAFGKGRHVAYRPSGAREVRSAGEAFLDMRERIERQIEQRTMMLTGVSHDLRTPLTRLQLALGMQEQDEETVEMQRDLRDMGRLLDEFLAFARGDALDDPEPVDARALVIGVVEDACRGGQKVGQGRLDQTGPVPMRPLAVTRALENLIGNAVRYGEHALVSLERHDGSVWLVVEDDGPGIPEALREKALAPFTRLDPSRNQDRAAGVGLGLSIAADIARRHGGALRLGRSDRLGGLRAVISLPF